MGRKHKAAGMLHRAREKPAAVRLSDPRIQRLTARFLEIMEGMDVYLVDQSVMAGRVLEEAKKLLSKESFTTWYVEDLRISEGTVNNYVNTSALERHSPALIERWKYIGPAKIYRLARLPAERRKEVLEKEGIDEMSFLEFAALTRDDTPPQVEVTPNMLGHGVFEKAKALTTKLDAIVLPPIADPVLRKKVKDQLLEVASSARALAKAL